MVLLILFTILVLVASLERFRVIRDLPNYEVSNKGRIRNLKPRRLKPYVDKLGYSRINLCGKSRLVHRLVAKEWCPNQRTKLVWITMMGIRLTTAFQTLDGRLWLKTQETWANTGTARANTRGFRNTEASGWYTSATNTWACLKMTNKRLSLITITPKNTLECLLNSTKWIEKANVTYTF